MIIIYDLTIIIYNPGKGKVSLERSFIVQATVIKMIN